jgi:hypothetical protein
MPNAASWPRRRKRGRRDHRMTRAIATLMLLLSTYSASAAETAWDVLQRFGLTGVWAASCQHPSTQSNFFEIFSKDSNGLATRKVDRGAEIPIALSFVDSAQMISPSTLRMRIRNADRNWGQMNNLTYDVVFTKEDDPKSNEIFRIRALESIRSDGKVIAKGGILVVLGKPTFWLYKCRSAMSAAA